MRAFLDMTWWGNPIGRWLAAAGVAVAVYVAVRLFAKVKIIDTAIEMLRKIIRL